MIGIVGILTALLLPALSSSRDIVKRIGCASNLHQISLAFNSYVRDYDGFFYPPNAPDTGIDNNCTPQIWQGSTVHGVPATACNFGVLKPYVINLNVYYCPGMTWPDTSWYNMKPETSKGNFGKASVYAMSSYASCLFVENRRSNYKIGVWDELPAIAVDWLQKGLTSPFHNVFESDPNFAPAIAHGNVGWNAVKLDGSVKWWNKGDFSPAALCEPNSYSSGNHTGTMSFGSTISGFTIP